MADANKKLFRMLESVDDEKSFVGFWEKLLD